MQVTPEQAKANIAANINRILAERGWTQSDFARASGENVMTISRLCRGLHEPHASMLARIADALGVTTDHLLSLVKKSRQTA